MKKHLLIALTVLLTAAPAPQASATVQKRLHQAGAAALGVGSFANAVDTYNKREQLSRTIIALRMLASVAGIAGALKLLSKAGSEDTTQTNDTITVTQPDPVGPNVAPHPAVQPAPSRPLAIPEPAAILGLDKIFVVDTLINDGPTMMHTLPFSETTQTYTRIDESDVPSEVKNFCVKRGASKIIGVRRHAAPDDENIYLVQVSHRGMDYCYAFDRNGSQLSPRTFCEACQENRDRFVIRLMLNSREAIRNFFFPQNPKSTPCV